MNFSKVMEVMFLARLCGESWDNDSDQGCLCPNRPMIWWRDKEKPKIQTFSVLEKHILWG